MKKGRERAAGYHVRHNHLLGRLALLVGNMEKGKRDQSWKEFRQGGNELEHVVHVVLGVPMAPPWVWIKAQVIRSHEGVRYFRDIFQLSSWTDTRNIISGYKICLSLYQTSILLIPIHTNTSTLASKQMPLLTVRKKEVLLVRAKNTAVIKSNKKAHYALPTAFILSKICLHCSSQPFQNLLGLIL